MENMLLFDPNRHATTTSKLARDAGEKSGRFSADRAAALRLVKLYPGYTARMLERKAGVTDGKVRKRLGELLKLDLVKTGENRTCDVTHMKVKSWWPA